MHTKIPYEYAHIWSLSVSSANFWDFLFYKHEFSNQYTDVTILISIQPSSAIVKDMNRKE